MKVKLFTNIASHYRKAIWSRLLESPKVDIDIYFGSNQYLGIKSIDLTKKPFSDHQDRIFQLKNIWIKKRVLVWQIGVISVCLFGTFDKGIFLGESYCLSTWIASIVCRLRNIEVIFWGHGLYGNEGFLKLYFRKTFYLLADKHLLYERRAKKLMINEGFDPEKIYIVFNSLEYEVHKKLRDKYKNLRKKEIYTDLNNPELPVLIFIGRLTPEKDLDILVKTVNEIDRDKVKVNLVMIGDGPERKKLELLGAEGIKEGWINFIGACYNEEKLAQYLSAADLCVSPGNIGLTAIHSLSYGTPICTHGDFSNQMPEAEAIEEGYNGFLFKKGSKTDLGTKIKGWFRKEIDRKIVQDKCYQVVNQLYNPEYQLSVFKRLISDIPPKI